jgi:hypothetical protein
MSVYVDDMRAPFGRMVMCHMTADSTAELLAMVDKIGVRRKWIQKVGTPWEHFDICLGKRALAVRAGAIEEYGTDWVLRVYAKHPEVDKRRKAPQTGEGGDRNA